MIGKVGSQTKGVEKMLRRIGFRYAERVDPFDGGPHFVAPTDEITLVHDTQKMKIARLCPKKEHARHRSLVGVDLTEPPYFRSVLTDFIADEDGAGGLNNDAADHLGLKVGDEAWVLTLK